MIRVKLATYYMCISCTCSVIESREEVASSYTSMGEPFSTALAMATLCFSPPAGESNTEFRRRGEEG